MGDRFGLKRLARSRGPSGLMAGLAGSVLLKLSLWVGLSRSGVGGSNCPGRDEDMSMEQAKRREKKKREEDEEEKKKREMYL